MSDSEATLGLSLDARVKAIIAAMPDHFAPDEYNFLDDGRRYKAPDHSAFGGYLIIERKSRSDGVNDKIVPRLIEIGAKQGWQGGAYGMHRVDRILADFPDPIAANRQITDYAFRQMLKALKEAKEKFIEFGPHNSAPHSVRIVVFSDLSTQPGGNAAEEAFVGRKMGGYGAATDELQSIDAVILLKHPRYVFDEANSYWLKCLIKGTLNQRDRDNVIKVSELFHSTFGELPDFRNSMGRLRYGRFRPLIVGGG